MNDIKTLLEAKDSVALLQDELKRYYKAMSGKLPKNVQAAVFILNKYPVINTKEMILDIRDGRLSALKRIGVLDDDLKTLQSLLKRIGPNIRMLPQFLDERQRQALELNKLNMDDLTMDRETPAGRDALARQYTPLVIKIAGQYLGKCPLNKAELISAGMMGLANAINEYDPFNEDEKSKKHITFGQYAAYRIKYQILNDIEQYAHVTSVSGYQAKTLGNIQQQSLDAPIGNDPDNTINVDRILQLSEEPEPQFDNEKEKDFWEGVYKSLEKRFSSRDCEIFYCALGLNDHKKETGKDIAARFGVTPGFISQVIKKFITFMTTDKESYSLLANINNLYMEGLTARLMWCDRNTIVEALIADDIFMMFEEALRWEDKGVFEDSVRRAIEASTGKEALVRCLTDAAFLDESYRVNRTVITEFLSNLYPTRSFRGVGDVRILEDMGHLMDMAGKYDIKW